MIELCSVLISSYLVGAVEIAPNTMSVQYLIDDEIYEYVLPMNQYTQCTLNEESIS